MAEDSQKQNLSAAYELLKQWTDIGDADSFEQLGPAAVYKTSVVLWLMLYQRLNPKSSLRDAVLHFKETGQTNSRPINDCAMGLYQQKQALIATLGIA